MDTTLTNFAKQAIQVKMTKLPKSQNMLVGDVIDILLDLQLELISLAESVDPPVPVGV